MRWRVHPADHLLLLAPEHELAPGQFAMVDAHLAACAACRTRRIRLQRVLAGPATQATAHSDESTASHAAGRQRLEAALRHERRQLPSGWRAYVARVRQGSGAPLALAASVLLAALALQMSGPTLSGDAAVVAELGARPVPVFTPGAVSTLSADALCAGARPSRLVSAEARDQVLVEYGMQGASGDTYELDALVTPELGGTTARANLWPQRYDTVWNARVKDQLESLLADRVCTGTMPLRDAQDALARDWVDAYKRAFDTNAPLPSHLASTELDDELTVLEPVRPASSERGAMARHVTRVPWFREPTLALRRVAGRLEVRAASTSPTGTILQRS